MDVLLIDDKEGEDLVLHKAWDPEGIRIHHVDNLDDALLITNGGGPATDDAALPKFDAVIIDLDLGIESSGSAGGLQAASAVSQWRDREQQPFQIVLRTQDVDDDRSLSAVLAAELLGGPIPLWGKSSEDATSLLAYLREAANGETNPAKFGGMFVHPVTFMRGERGVKPLGAYLLNGRRGRVWTHIYEGMDADLAVASAGYVKRNKFWEDVNDLFSAIVYLRDMEDHMHRWDGTPLRLSDIERKIVLDELQEANFAIDGVSSGTYDVPAKSKDLVLALLKKRRDELDDWLNGLRNKRPSLNRNWDQGEFVGVFGRVIGNHDVYELFRALAD